MAVKDSNPRLRVNADFESALMHMVSQFLHVRRTPVKAVKVPEHFGPFFMQTSRPLIAGHDASAP